MDTKDTNTTRFAARNKMMIALAVIILLSLPLIALGDVVPHSTNSMMAESPVTSYTAGVMLYMLLVGFLVTFLLGGAFAVLNIGLMSKRDSDSSLGHQDPSDVSLLRSHRPRAVLPAEEGEIEDPLIQVRTRQEWASGASLVTEDQMFFDGEKRVA
jgi:hypothetical protein